MLFSTIQHTNQVSSEVIGLEKSSKELKSKYLIDFYEFGDSCSGSRSCFISSSSKVKCEIPAQPVRSSFGAKDKVVGFDFENRKIIRPASPSSRDQQTFSNNVRIINPGTDLLKPKIILGLRRIPLSTRTTQDISLSSKSSSGYSDYDDTDLNPNILINYLNR